MRNDKNCIFFFFFLPPCSRVSEIWCRIVITRSPNSFVIGTRFTVRRITFYNVIYIIIILSRYDNGGRYYTLTSAPLNPRDDHIVGANSVKGTREMAENKRLSSSSSSSVAAPAQSFRLINAVRCKYSLVNIRPSRLLITIANNNNNNNDDDNNTARVVVLLLCMELVGCLCVESRSTTTTFRVVTSVFRSRRRR